MQSDSSNFQKFSQNWIAITWQLGDRERQLRRSLVSPEETMSEVLQRALMEACVMGYLNKKIAFTEPEKFVTQWRAFVIRDGEEIELALEKKVEALSLSTGERLILRPQSSTSEGRHFSVDDLPGATGLPQSFIQTSSKKSPWLTYLLIGTVLLLVALVVLVVLKL